MSLDTLRFMDKIDTRKQEHLAFKGDDGREYLTSEALARANRAHFQNTHFYIVHDAELGRRQIRPGIGEVQVCVGHLIETDRSGRKKYVPVYSTENF